VVPPNTGIVHQVNLEYLGRVVFHKKSGDANQSASAGGPRHRPLGASR
jgi:aconitase A